MAPIQQKISDGLGVGEVTATTDMVGATKLTPSTSPPTVTLPLQHTSLYSYSVI
jgi:hypothetical protein